MNQKRIARVIENMKGQGFERILVTAPASVYYLTSARVQPGERMLALLVTSDGDIKLLANRMFALQGQGLPLVEYGDTDDPVALLSESLPAGIVGIDKQWASLFTLRLMALRPDVKPVLGSGPVDLARMIKDAAELDALRTSSHANDRALRETLSALAAGVTELEIGRAYASAAQAQGAVGVGFSPLICFGAGGAEPHHESDSTPLKKGDAVILDVGLNIAEGLSDMTRTVFFGKASEKQRAVYELVREANEAGRAAVKPGVPLRDIDRAARGVIERAGYGEYFTHRTGHGLGLEIHEPPDVSARAEEIALPGMVFSIEPGIYLPGEFGMRIEDLVAVTETGCETLNEFPRDLLEL